MKKLSLSKGAYVHLSLIYLDRLYVLFIPSSLEINYTDDIREARKLFEEYNDLARLLVHDLFGAGIVMMSKLVDYADLKLISECQNFSSTVKKLYEENKWAYINMPENDNDPGLLLSPENMRKYSKEVGAVRAILFLCNKYFPTVYRVEGMINAFLISYHTWRLDYSEKLKANIMTCNGLAKEETIQRGMEL